MQTICGAVRYGAARLCIFACFFAAPASASWLDYQHYTIQRIGLFGSEQTRADGLQNSFFPVFFPSYQPGFFAGCSQRFTSTSEDNGQDAWAWNGSTTQIGLTSGVHTGSAGYQISVPQLQNASGQVAGTSQRYLGVNTSNGQDAWVWNGTTTTQVGLSGGAYTGIAGYQSSYPLFQNAGGQVAGISQRYTGVSTFNGQDAWVWNGTTTTQVGLSGGAYTGIAGYQYSYPQLQNAGGQVAGISQRYTGMDTLNGQDTWVWNGAATTQIGFTGAGYTGSSGYQHSYPQLQNAAGQIAGYSIRITGVSTEIGQDAWVWNGTTTTQLGFIGGVYSGSAGYRASVPAMQNSAGQVVGYSTRYAGVNTHIGNDSWVWNGIATTQIGLTGGVYTGSTGYQDSTPQFQNTAGHVAGVSSRFTGVNTDNGTDAWAWNGTNTQQIGLVGGVHTSSTGYQLSYPTRQNDSGQVVGTSARFVGANTLNGADAWIWNGSTTMQIGLTGGVYSGSGGYQQSTPQIQNAFGIVTGTSRRIFGVNTGIGYDTWYFDPATQITTAVIASIRTTDNYAFSSGTLLTQNGFLLGNYTFFLDGIGAGEDRAFIFRPDLGFTDLGDLVTGGLTLSGWSTLLRPQFADALNTIVGYGYVNGQTTGQSVFVMSIPAPGAAGLLGLCGVVVLRRRR